MLKAVNLLILLLSAGMSFAQITITSAIFPVPGDTLSEANDSLANSINVTLAGPNQTWDFKAVEKHTEDETIFLDPTQGQQASQFPNATCFVSLDLDAEQYYQATSNQFNLLGITGIVSPFGGVNTARFNPALQVLKSPLNYNDRYNQKTDVILFYIPVEFIPDSILNNLPIKPDSIRIKQKFSESVIVDAYGKAELPNKTYNVLRLNTVNISSNVIEARLPFFGWQDLTSVAISSGVFPAEAFVPDTSLSHVFLSDESKGFVASVEISDEGIPISVSVKNDNRIISANEDQPNLTKPYFSATPNPVVSYVVFDCRNIKSGKYSIEIKNLLGRKVWSKSYELNGSKKIKEEIGYLPKGAYLYSLINEKGFAISTKKLLILKP